jgi:hypothetical protein
MPSDIDSFIPNWDRQSLPISAHGGIMQRIDAKNAAIWDQVRIRGHGWIASVGRDLGEGLSGTEEVYWKLTAVC